MFDEGNEDEETNEPEDPLEGLEGDAESEDHWGDSDGTDTDD